MRVRFCRAAAHAAVAVLFSLVAAFPALAVTRTWTNNNGTGDGRWLTAANWSPAGVPGSGDVVEIGVTDQTSNYCIVDGAANASSVTLGNVFTNNPTLEIKSGATLTIANASVTDAGTTLYFNNGNLAGAGALTVNGTFNFNGGTLGGSAGMTLNSGSAMNLQCGANYCYLARNITNDGIITFSSSVYETYLYTSSVISNTGLIDFQADEHLWISGAGPFRIDNQNTGIIRKSGGATGTNIKCTVNNASGALIESDVSTLTLEAGGTSYGAFDASVGTVIAITSATYTFENGTTVTGSGKIAVYAILSIPTGSDVTIPNLQLANSSAKIDGDGILRIGTFLDWDAGTMTGGGTTIITSSATGNFDCASSYCYLDNRQFNVAIGATVNYTPTTYALYFYNSSSLNLNSTSTLNIQTDQDFNYGGGTASSINNSGGTIQKTSGSGATSFNVALTSSGTLSTTTGDLLFGAATTISGGTLNAATGSNLEITGNTFTFSSAASITGTGNFRVSGGTLRVPTGVTQEIPRFSMLTGSAFVDGGGTLQLSGTCTWAGGTMGTASATGGTTEVKSGATLNITNTTSYAYLDYDRTLLNNGTVNYAPVTYSFYLYNQSDVVNNGAFDLQNDTSINVGGSAPRVFTNNGTFTKSGGTGATGAFMNAELDNAATGTVTISSGRLNLAGTGTGSGAFDIASGAYLQLTNTYDFAATPTVTGSGTVRVFSSGHLIVPTGVTLTVPNLVFDAGYISGGGTLRISSTGTWSGGTMGHPTYPNGTTEVMLSASLSIDGGNSYAYLDQGRTLLNNNVVNYTSPAYGIWLYNGSTLNNAGTLNYSTDIGIGVSGSSTLIANSGTIYKNSGTGAATISPPVNNSGTIQADSGSLVLSGNGTHAGGDFVGNGSGAVGFSGGTHTLDASSSLTGTGTILVSGGTVTVAGSYNPVKLTLTGGTLTLNSNGSAGILFMTSSAIVNGSGAFTITDDSTWNGGTMAGSGSTVVSSGKTLTIAATTNYCYLETRTLTNNGTIVYPATTSNYHLYLYSNGTLANAGTFQITSDQILYGQSNGTINNSGTFTKTAGSGNTIVSPVFNNTGSVSVISGGVSFNFNGTHSGSFTPTSPGAIAFSGGTHTISGPGTISGTGTLGFTGAAATVTTTYTVGTLKVTAGSATLDANGSANALDMSGGTLNGTGALTLNNGGTWSGGTMGGSGSTIIPASQTLSIIGSTTSCNLDARTLTNNGIINYTASTYYLQIYSSGTLANNGTFNYLTDQNLYGSSNGVINNAGAFNRSSGNGAATVSPIFNNTGSVSITSGTLNFSGNGTHTGNWSVTSPATLAFSGGTHTAGAGTISGTGTLSFPGGSSTFAGNYTVGALSLSGGTANMNGTGSADAFTFTAGTLGGTGTLTLNNGGTWSGGTMNGGGTTILPALKTLALSTATNYPTLDNRTFTNNGAVTYAGGAYYFQIYNSAAFNNAGSFTVTGGTYVYGTGGGTFNNSGTFTKSGGPLMDFHPILNNTGQLTVSAGTLAIHGGGTHTNGLFTATAPGVIQFANGTHTLSGTGSLGGTGTYAVTGGTTNVGVPYTLATLSMSNGTINFNTNGSIGVLSMSYGILAGTGTVTVTDDSSWTGGTMQGSGATVFSVGKTVTIGGANYVTIDTRIVTNNGTFNYVAPTYYFQIYNNGVFNNAGVLALQTDLYIYGYGGGAINNTGTISRTTGTGNTTTIYPVVNNNGTVNVTVGTIELQGGGTSSGIFSATSPAAIQFTSGTHNILAAASLTGTGRYRVNSGTVNVDGTWTGIPIDILNGTLNLNTNGTATLLNLTGGGAVLGGTGNVTVTGNSNWSAGTMQGTGTTTFDTGILVTMPGTSYTTLNRPLVNKGTIEYTAPTYYFQINGATITNDGVFDVQTPQIIYAYGVAPSFVNNGTLKKTAGTGTMQFYAPLTNTGTVQVGSGTMYFSNAYVQNGGTTELLNNATLQTATLDLNAGSLIGNGTVSGNVTSDGIVAPGASAGTLTITGNYTQSASGAMNIELGGTTAGTQYDQLVVQGTVTLGGTLNVSLINSFFPAGGNTFQILTFASRPGSTDFATKNGLNLGSGTNLIDAYSATDLQLTTNSVQADLAIAMNAAPASVSNGGAFAWNITVTNNGGSNASGVTVTATVPANATFTSAAPAICTGAPNLVCTIGTLPNLGTANLTINATANGTGTASMTANVAGSQFDPNGTNNSAVAGPSITANADLGVSITDSPDPVAAGAVVTYTITVSNAGFDSANGVTLNTTPSAGLTFNSASAPCGTGFPCSLGNLGSGANSVITASYTVSPSATGTAQLGASVSASSPADPNNANNTATQSTSIAQDADVQVVKSGPTNVPPESGSTITYNIAVTNNGPSIASSVNLTDPTPSGLTLVSVTGDCSAFPCAIGTMTVGQTKSIQATYQINGAIGTTFINTATVTSGADSVPGNNSSSVTTTVSNCPATSITAPPSVNGGSTGNAASVTAIAGASYAWSIGNGTITSGASTNAITFTAGGSGAVTLSVTVTSGACTSNPSATVLIVSADLVVSKTGPANVSPTTVTSVTYTVNVSNNGPAAANSVVVNDPTPFGLVFVSATGACTAFPCSVGTLTSGQSISTQVTYSFTGGAQQTVTNTASATSSTSDPNSINNSGSASTIIAACPAVTITGPAAMEPATSSTATATVVANATYNWTISNGTINSGQGTNAIGFTANAAGTTTLNVSVTFPTAQCSTGASHSIAVTSTQADVGISKTSPPSVASGAQFTYTLSISNNGPANADNVAASDSLPAGVTFVSVDSPQCSGGATVNCAFGTLASGATTVVNITVTAPQGPTTLTNTAQVSTTSADPNNVNNTSTITTTISAPPVGCPPAGPSLNVPSNGATLSAGAITFGWNAVTNASVYELWLGVDGATPSLTQTTAGTSTSLTLGAGSYAWYVVAKGDPSCTAMSSATRTFVIPGCPAASPTLNAPADTASLTPGSITFSWSAVATATSYELWLGANGATPSLAQTTGATSASMTLAAGSYAWYVVAKGDPSCTPMPSATRTFTVAAIVECPATAPNLNAPADGASTLTSPVTFSWSLVLNATAYELWLGPNPDSLVLSETTAGTSLSVTLGSGTYAWQVVARGDGSCTPRSSNIRTFTIPPVDTCGEHTSPTLVGPIGVTVGSPVTFDWNGVAGAAGYIVRIGIDGGALQELGSTTAAVTELTAAVPPGTIKWAVDAIFSNCPSTRSDEATFIVPQLGACEGTAQPIAPANGSTTANAIVDFSWTSVAKATGYRIWLQTGSNAPEVIGSTLATSLTKTLSAGTHSWWAETLFEGCPSHESAHVSFTILPAQNCEGRGKPSLVSPANGTTTSNASMTFSWSAVTNAIEYELYLALNGGVPTLIGTTAAASLTAEVAPGNLEWFVRALFNGCQPTESDHRTFTYEPPANCAANARPVLIAPAEGEKVGSPAKFDWNDVTGATGYELWIDDQLAASTNASDATVQHPLGAGRWFVRAKFAQGCAALDSTESKFVIVPPVAACSPLDAPDLSVPGQISSGVDARLQWSFVAGATSYTLQIANDPSFGAGTDTVDTGNGRQHHLQLENGGTEPLARYIRVRANDSRCNPTLNGPWSGTAVLYILPETGNEASALIGEPSDVEYSLPLPSELAGQTFTATPTASWITVMPSTGTVPPGGMFLTVVAHTAGLPPGTSIGGVTISTGASGRISTQGSTTTTTVSVSLVSPVTPTPKSTPPPDALVIPAVANADGVSAHFQSDVRVSNTSAQVMKYQLSFIPTGEAGISAGRQTTFSIEPGRTVALDDILKSWFGTGTSNAIGTLEVRPLTEVAKSTISAPVGALANLVTFASSRTFNATPNGTFGQYIPAIPFANFIGRNADALKPTILSLQQIAQSEKYRTNLGIVEGSGESASLLVKVFGSTGAKLTEFPVNLNGGQHVQLNSFLTQQGINDLDDGRVEVQVVGGNGKVTAYASVLDNSTSDPLLVSPVTLSDKDNNKWVMPGVADLNNGAANWQTDMRVFNAGSAPEELTLAFYSMNGGQPLTAKVTLQPGEVRQFDRILQNTFGVTQNGGAVHITSADPARLIATSRTYNLTTQGTYGQFISAVTPAEAAGVGSRPLQLLQVEESSRYRSNIGLAEVTGKPVTLEVSIVPPDAKFTATVKVDLAANEFRQLPSMLAGLGLGDTYNARISIRAIAGEGRATAYASVIDAETNDPTLVPAQ